jgi:regulator of replication initiation timing
MVQSLLIPSSFYTRLLLALLLSNRVHGFGGVSMNPLLSSRMMVTRGYSLTRAHSERNDITFLPWNMARTPTTKHAHADAHADADADAEGSPAFGKYELKERMMRSMLETQKDMAENMATTKEQIQGLESTLSSLQDEGKQLRDEHKQLRGMLQDMEKRQGKMATKEQVQDLENSLSELEHIIRGLARIEARAKAGPKVANEFN